MRKISENVAFKVCGLLESVGIKCESSFTEEPIGLLRDSWYVDKVKQCGHTDMVHITIKNDDFRAFIAVLEDGKIMSGCNPMICDAFYGIWFSVIGDPDEFFCCDQDGFWFRGNEEDGIIICELYQFRRFLDQSNLLNAVRFLRRYISRNDIAREWEMMYKMRCPISNDMVCCISDLMEEFTNDNDLPEDWWDAYFEEEIFEML